ncbi:MAG TPA: ISL3 family transposase [Acidimicrobiia bacterium]|jgi:transposase|nr:ISL3 family transposase [Acidimicrobiia bacterium]
MGDRIQVPLELDDFEVVDSVLAGGELAVTVRSTFPRACFHCGSTDVVGHGRQSRRIRDRACGYPTTLIWEQRRYKCRDCGRTSRERHPETLGAKRLTGRFHDHLAESARNEPWVDICRRERVSWWRVADAFDRLAAGHDPYTGPPARVLSLDEAAFKKRRRFQTILSAPEQHRIIEVEQGRSRLSAAKLLYGLPQTWRDQVQTVVIDMFWPYRQAVEQALPHARIVVDKFHVIRAVDNAAQRVRIRHGRKVTVVGRDGGLARQHNPRFIPDVWRSRWLYMRRHHRLTPDEIVGLQQLFELQPEIGVAYWLKEAFANIYTAPNRIEATRRAQLWAHHVTQANIPELTNLARTLAPWTQLILNYFDDPQTNGYAEGVTNKIKVLKRRGYGHNNPHRYRAKILLTTRHHPKHPPPNA